MGLFFWLSCFYDDGVGVGGLKFVSQIYTDVAVGSVDGAGNPMMGGGRTALVVYADGQIADFYEENI